MAGAELIELQRIADARGPIFVAEVGAALPFEVRRVFMLQQVAFNPRRGGHAHQTLEQVLICVNGRALVKESNRLFSLTSPGFGLYVAPMTWVDVELVPGSLLLVLASAEYDEADYIRDRAEFDRLTAAAA